MTRKPIGPLVLFAALLSCGALLSGCDAMAYMLYMISPRNADVEAEYEALNEGSVAIVVYADQATEYEYFDVRRSVSMTVLGELERRVEGVEIIDPARVVRYQDENIYWDEMPKTQLGKALGADFILFISLLEFSTREPGSLNLYRGRITAQVGLFKTALAERQARVWYAREVRVRYPENDPTGELSESDRKIRERTEQKFADKLAKKFYDHEVPIE